MHARNIALYASGTTNFDTQGLGILRDALTCESTETAATNGNITYTLELTYPISGYLADQLTNGNLIRAQVGSSSDDYMIFEIVNNVKADSGTITVYADAYPYRILRMSFDNGGIFGKYGSVQDALTALKSQIADFPSDFQLISGVGTAVDLTQAASTSASSSTTTTTNQQPTSWATFGDALNEIMNQISGQVEYGVKYIRIYSVRGADVNTTMLRDDKNTNGVSIKTDTENIVNRIIPMLPVIGSDGNATGTYKVGSIVTSSVAHNWINFWSAKVVQVTDQNYANNYFNITSCDRPTLTATVTTSMLDQDLSDVHLFDRLTVYSKRINYAAKLQISTRVFDNLTGEVSSFSLGSSAVTVFTQQQTTVNQIASLLQDTQYAIASANGKNTNYYGGTNAPTNPSEGDYWFVKIDGVSYIKQYQAGNWVVIVSDATQDQIKQTVAQAIADGQDALKNANTAVDTANQSLTKAQSAIDSANNASGMANTASQDAADAKSTASSALNNSVSAIQQAQSAASDATSAANIANAVSQSVANLKDGSTMTIAELESGLALKITKDDMNTALQPYATQSWTSTEISATADEINSSIASVKKTADGNTTDVTTLQQRADGFDTSISNLTSTKADQSWTTNQIKASADSLNVNIAKVQTQVDNYEVGGTNLLTGSDFKQGIPAFINTVNNATVSVIDDSIYGKCLKIVPSGSYYSGTNSGSYLQGGLISSDNTAYSYQTLIKADSSCTVYMGYQGSYVNNSTAFNVTTDWQLIKVENDFNTVGTYSLHFYSKSNVTFYITRVKLERGTKITDWSANPADNATVTSVTNLSVTLDGIKQTVAKKVDNDTFVSYQTQTATLIGSKVASTDFNSYKAQTDNAISQRVTSSTFSSYQTQTDEAIQQRVTSDTYQTQIQQLSDNINLRVQKNDVINQINVSSESILIAGNKIHITGSTTIDDAAIGSAKISTLSASKVIGGTLDFNQVTATNINANSITSGTLKGVAIGQTGSTYTTALENGDLKFQDQNGNNSIKMGPLFDSNTNAFVGGGISITEGRKFSIGQGNTSNTNQVNLIAIPSDSVHDNPYVLIDNARFGFASTRPTFIANWLINPKGVQLIAGVGGVSIGYADGWGDATHAPGVGTIMDIKSGAIDAYQNLVVYNGFRTYSNIQLGSNSINPGIIDLGGMLYIGGTGGAALGTYNWQTGRTGGTFTVQSGGVKCYTQFNVYNGSKNAAMVTRDGVRLTPAYETAENYVGDIGENNTGSGSQIRIFIDPLYFDMVNTANGYHVFVTPYSNSRIWVTDRLEDSFIVHSDQPNVDFSWEIKVHRRGYESERLEKSDMTLDEVQQIEETGGLQKAS
ncbi:gp58-like family protein [Liquorilactobacillus hordei]|uniref:gp58-like family protein n=1 Tax=Liquorilactobacillus hordei TaxID=468911 RepID=UPI0039EB8160